MYAIIRAGGKQAKVKAGDVIEIERVKDAADSMTFTPIMVVGEDGSTMTDRDSLSDVKVVAEVLGETKGDKIDIFKYKNKTGYRRHLGHRQTYTQIRVTSIDLPKEKSSKAQSSKAEPAKAQSAKAQSAGAQSAGAQTSETGVTKSSTTTEAPTGKQTEED